MKRYNYSFFAVIALMLCAHYCPAPHSSSSSKKKISVDFSDRSKLSGKIEESKIDPKHLREQKDVTKLSPMEKAKENLRRAKEYMSEAKTSLEKENASFVLKRAELEYEKQKKISSQKQKYRKFWEERDRKLAGKDKQSEKEKSPRDRPISTVVIVTAPDKITSSLPQPKL
tara:strand:- start:673 stop:1185 length:513 start_codon:yes stop_codon:yes gene_type:complete